MSPSVNFFSPVLGFVPEWVMKQAVAMRNRGFDRGRHVHDVGVPVVSIGNISVGGTGKSPMVRWVTSRLIEAGRRPAIAIRGYGAKEGVSDEAEEHRALLDEVPVLVGADRVRQIRAALEAGVAIDCVVLDDGFQHRFVKRDLDIVLVDARHPPDTGRLLPVGRLREPAGNLRRADVVVVTHADHAAPTLRSRIEALHGKAPVAECVHVWDGLDRHVQGQCERIEVGALKGLQVVTRLGLARPEGVHNMLEMHGATVSADCKAKDHQPVTAQELAHLIDAARDADGLVVTAKDMATMAPLLQDRALDVPVLVPRLGLRFLTGESQLRSCLERLDVSP
ncbi:MAG: tetraacyldisaccharide 4'-kinase [Phycisphaerales bacterium]|nr:tetraacyldisaccharide 4'-kinase [Phycisphaerales bacterium]